MRKKEQVHQLECIAPSAGGTGSLWSLVTSSGLAATLRPGYFAQQFANYRLRLADRINVTSRVGDDMEFAVLVVTAEAEKTTPVKVAQLKGGGAL